MFHWTMDDIHKQKILFNDTWLRIASTATNNEKKNRKEGCYYKRGWGQRAFTIIIDDHLCLSHLLRKEEQKEWKKQRKTKFILKMTPKTNFPIKHHYSKQSIRLSAIRLLHWENRHLYPWWFNEKQHFWKIIFLTKLTTSTYTQGIEH